MKAEVSQSITPDQRIQELISWFEAGTPAKDGVDSFNMRVYIEHNKCGTSACIAGATAQFEQTRLGLPPIKNCQNIAEFRPDIAGQYYDLKDYASDLLGLTAAEGSYLFTENIAATASDAAKCLRRLRDKRKLQWYGDKHGGFDIGKLPSKNSLLLGQNGLPIQSSGEQVLAVLNTNTGLIRAWHPFGTKVSTHFNAPAMASSVTQLPNHTPFRMPSLVELKTIGGGGANGTYVPDADEYPDLIDQWYWAADVDASGPEDLAWGVRFSGGYSWRTYRDNLARVLAVCSPASQ